MTAAPITCPVSDTPLYAYIARTLSRRTASRATASSTNPSPSPASVRVAGSANDSAAVATTGAATQRAVRHLTHREHGLGAGTDIERAQDGRNVVLDGLDRQAELARDQLVRQTLEQQRKHIGLARREADLGQRRGRRLVLLRLLAHHAQHARHGVALGL